MSSLSNENLKKTVLKLFEESLRKVQNKVFRIDDPGDKYRKLNDYELAIFKNEFVNELYQEIKFLTNNFGDGTFLFSEFDLRLPQEKIDEAYKKVGGIKKVAGNSVESVIQNILFKILKRIPVYVFCDQVRFDWIQESEEPFWKELQGSFEHRIDNMYKHVEVVVETIIDLMRQPLVHRS